MQALFEQLEAVHPLVPPTIRAVIVIAVVLLLWIIASLPAYWIVQALSPALSKLSTLLLNARTLALTHAGKLFAARQISVAQFVETHAQVFSLTRENDQVVSGLNIIQQTISDLPTAGDSLERRIDDAGKATRESRVTHQRIEWPQLVDAPTPQQYSLIRVEQNDAWLRTIVFTIFSAFLIAINTLMLKAFFASIMPPNLRFFDIPVSVIFSFMFSVLELIFGFCLAFVERASFSISGLLRAVLLIALTLLALIELGFYAQFGAELDFSPFESLWAPEKPPAWSKLWLGLFGPLVVMGLGFSGHGLAAALRELFRDNVIHQYRKFLYSITRKADELRRSVETAREASDDQLTVLKGLEQRYKSLAGGIPEAVKQVDQIRTQLESIVAQAQSSRQNPFQQIGPAEMLRTYLSLVFIAPTMAIAFMLIAVAFGALGYSEPFTIDRLVLPGFGVAAAETGLMVGIGYATGRIVTRTSGHDAANSLGFLVACAFAYTAVTALIMANGIAFFHRGTWVDFIWFAFTCAANFWLFVIGRRLGLMLAAIWAFMQACAALMASLLLLAIAGLLLVFACIVYVFATIIQMIAFPFRVLFRRKSNEEGRPFTTTATAVALALLIGNTTSIRPGAAQQTSQEPQSSISVLVDLSTTWHNPARQSENAHVLKVVSAAVVQLVANVEPPISIRYLPIGDLSLGKALLCQVDFTPKLIGKGRESNVLSKTKELQEYLTGACLRYILSRRQEKFTDISGALDSAYRYTEHQVGPFKCVIMLSDFKEERRPSQPSLKLHLAGMKMILLYRVLDEDRLDPSKLVGRLHGWRTAIKDAGGEAVDLSDVAASAGQISRMCQ